MLARKALAGTAGAPKEYVEDVFSTDLFVGNSSSQTVTNNIDLSGEGGLVWLKNRGPGTDSHRLFDTARTLGYNLNTNNALAEAIDSGRDVTAYSSTGYTVNVSDFNTDDTWVSWTFRKAEKFFDIVTYSGNSVDDRAISHNLGSTPGCVIVRRLSGDDWFVYHRSLAANNGLRLNKTDSASSNTSTVKSVSSTTFTVGTDGMVNVSGSDYVAYLFAHDAGGFGDAGSDSIIKCGSYTGIGASSGPEIDLGWEPQWLLIKAAESANNWLLFDNMRGMNVIPSDDNVKQLFANTSGAEASAQRIIPTATGFKVTINDSILNSNGATYIYIAIRRGPMKTPTTGTSVFGDTYASVEPVSTNLTTESGVLADLVVHGLRISGTSFGRHWMSRLTGDGRYLVSSSPNAEVFQSNFWKFDNNNYAYIPPSGYANNSGTGTPYVAYSFKRAPKFFDVVCYTGTGANRTVSHNLGVAPELMIVACRSSGEYWPVYSSQLGASKALLLQLTGDDDDYSANWNSTAPTSSVFSVDADNRVNASGSTYVAYLFASLSGVSKIGTYTGNGSSVTVTTDFQPRFILVKRTNSTGNWIVGDSARGLVSADEPALFLNSTAAETTGQDWVDVSSTGFTVNETALNANVNTGTYLYLAIS